VTNADRTRTRSDWSAVRLHVVTGKGGTGKTTVAGALALALAAGGARHGERRVLLVEVEGRQGVAQLFDTPPVPYEERRVAVTPDGGEVWALAIDAEQALLEYLDMFYKLGPAARALRRFGAIDFATTIAPGIRDVLLTGKTCEAVRRRAPDAGRGSDHDRVFQYDAVVMDAPPTGRITRFLGVNSEVSGLARVGPIRNQADAVMRVLTSAQTAVHFVTLLEEMPVQETLDGIEELRGLPGGPIAPGAIVVNMHRPLDLPGDQLAAAAAGRLDPGELAVGLKAAGLDDSRGLAASLVAELTDQARTALAEQVQRQRLDEPGQPVYELPVVTDGMDLAGLYRLAALLREQGAA
jgi:anion-transporting  ArsA/GET3 family ATPase